MFEIKQSTAIDFPFFVHNENGSGVTGLADGDFTKRVSKGGASFDSMTTSIAEMENGWYVTTLSSSHTDTLGMLVCTFKHANSELINLEFRVRARLPDDLAYPTTSGRSMDVNSDGTVDPNLTNAVGSLAKGTQITGFNDPAASSVADAVWDETKSEHTTSTSFGDLATDIDAIEADTNELQGDWTNGGRLDLLIDSIITKIDALNDFDPDSDRVRLSETGVDDILDEVVENSKTLRQYLRIMKAALAGKSTGGGTSANNFRDDADGKNRIAATVDADGNRTSVTVDGS